MKNGDVKHSTLLVEADMAGEKKLAERLAAAGMKIERMSLQSLQRNPGHYINFKGSLKGPFDDPNQATEAHREWMWESKHG